VQHMHGATLLWLAFSMYSSTKQRTGQHLKVSPALFICICVKLLYMMGACVIQ